jgi:flagellar hook-basal body complex protein FliE
VNGIEAVAAVGSTDTAPLAMRLGGVPTTAAPQMQGAGFGDILLAGLRGVDQKIAAAENLVQRFAVDDSVPVHQVTMALAEARLSVELAMQVRTRLVEGYRELMNMPL